MIDKTNVTLLVRWEFQPDMRITQFLQIWNQSGNNGENLWLFMSSAKEYDVVLLEFGLYVIIRWK